VRRRVPAPALVVLLLLPLLASPGAAAAGPGEDAAVLLVRDTFSREAGEGWGGADRGGEWRAAGSASTWRAEGGSGVVTLSQPGVAVSNDLAVLATDVHGVVDLAIDELPGAGGVHVSTVLRRLGASDYRLTVVLGAAGTLRLAASRVGDGVGVELATASVPGIVYSAGDVVRLRFQAGGRGTTHLSAKIWNVLGPEPSNPQLVTADRTPALQSGGGFAVVGYLSPEATGAPVEIRFDDLELRGTPGRVASPPEGEPILEADFDTMPLGAVRPARLREELGGGTADREALEDSTIVADPGGAGRVYRLRLDAGSYRDHPEGNNGIVAFVPLSGPVENACLSYDVRFDDDFDFSLGGKLPGLQGTAPGAPLATPTGGGNPGERGWSSRGMWVGPGAYSWAGPSNMAISYVYGPEQQDHYGDNLAWNRAFTPGAWHRVTQCHTMNTVGSADGTLEAWMDGVKVVDVRDQVYRLRDDVAVSHLNWSIFRGGDSMAWAGSRTGYVDIDNVVVTTR
jgi:hypothetical protein